jgi:hypothetical protein
MAHADSERGGELRFAEVVHFNSSDPKALDGTL